jgi:hypothetical protein
MCEEYLETNLVASVPVPNITLSSVSLTPSLDVLFLEAVANFNTDPSNT